MDRVDGGRGALVVVALLVFATVVPIVGAATAPPVQQTQQATTADLAQVAEEDNIVLTQEFSLTPEQPGSVNVSLSYDVPDRVVSMETRVPENATVTASAGFVRVNQTTFEWDGQTDPATINYRIDPNETIDKSGPEGADGRYIAADAGDWALFTRSRTPTRWEYTGSEQMGFRRNLTTDGPGATGEWLVYLGEGATFEETASNQTFRLFVPERATMTESPPEVLNSLAAASNSLRVGDRDEQVFVIAAPTGEVDWGVRGLQTGQSDMWVRDTERLGTADNVWLHEYVHSRQSFETTAETRWLTEGSAAYYAALLSLEQDRIDFATFRDRLAEGANGEFEDVVLIDSATWGAGGNYFTGPLVAGHVDRRIRVATESEQTFQNALRVINGLNEPVTQEGFLAAVERTGGAATAANASTYTETATVPDMWDEQTHSRVFAQLPARIGYSLPASDDPSGYRADGPYRTNASVGGTDPIRLATRERLTADVRVENAGGTTGTYNASLSINGTAVTTEQGRLEPGEQRTVPLSHTFATPGRYELSVDGDNVTVLVERPARTRVESIELSSRTAQQGDTIVVTATVVNDAEIPAEGTVVFTRDFEAVAEREVRLPPESTTRVSSGIPLPEAGAVQLSAGEASPIEVTVSPGPTSTGRTAASQTETTGGDGAGFTAVAALVALVVAALTARRLSSV